MILMVRTGGASSRGLDGWLRHWLTVLLVSWVVGLVASGGLKIAALLVLAACFATAVVALPLARNGRLALVWCVVSSVAAVSYELHPIELQPSTSVSTVLVVFAISTVLFLGTIVAFGVAMEAIAGSVGSGASMQHWRVVLRWQLYTVAGVALIFGIAKALGTPTGPNEVTLDAPLALLLMLGMLGSIAFAFIVYPAMGIVRLRRHLRG